MQQIRVLTGLIFGCWFWTDSSMTFNPLHPCASSTARILQRLGVESRFIVCVLMCPCWWGLVQMFLGRSCSSGRFWNSLLSPFDHVIGVISGSVNERCGPFLLHLRSCPPSDPKRRGAPGFGSADGQSAKKKLHKVSRLPWTESPPA